MQTITDTNKLTILAKNAVMREHEAFHYQLNIDNYTLMLATLPLDAWPVDLEQFREFKIDELPVWLSDEQVQLISDYQYRERLTKLLRTEKVEQTKVMRIYDVLLAQIPEDQRETLISAADAARVAAEVVQQ